MDDMPSARAWFVGDEIDPADPLAAVKRRAREVLEQHEQELAGQRKRKVARRAGRLDQITGLFTDPAFDPLELSDTAAAAGISEADLDAAAYLALILRQAELGGDGLAILVVYESPGQATAAG